MRILLFAILITCGLNTEAQKLPDFGLNKVRISGDNTVIQAELLPAKSDTETETGKMYYWYSSNIIHATQGGFSGRLLNGRYTEFYLNKNIKEDGQFKKGLKDGVWKSWDEKGALTQTVTWKSGIKQGRFVAFDDKGLVKQRGFYSDNLLNGTLSTTDETGNVTTTKYKKGKPIIDSPSKFWQKVKAKVFKKRPARKPKATPKEKSGV